MPRYSRLEPPFLLSSPSPLVRADVTSWFFLMSGQSIEYATRAAGNNEPGLRPQAPPAAPSRRGLVPRHYRLEPPYCAASLVARAIDYTAALFFVWR
jgi:hypothetical protein